MFHFMSSLLPPNQTIHFIGKSSQDKTMQFQDLYLFKTENDTRQERTPETGEVIFFLSAQNPAGYMQAR